MINAELQRHQLDRLIRQGMDVLLQAPGDWMQQHTLGAIDSFHIEAEPSHWFG